MKDTPRICIVIPCYNEEQRLPAERLVEAIKNDPELELCLVNDGSTDGTSALLNSLHKEHGDRMRVLELYQNSGKAEAVRQGMLKMAEVSSAGFIAYFDADLATPLEEARHLLDRIPDNGKVVMIIGSRVKLLGTTDIRRNLLRHYFGRFFATVVSNILDLPVYDTQCGAKVFRKDAVTELFRETFESKWLFDVELIYRCLIKFGREKTPEHVLELNIRKCHDVGGSKIRPGAVLKVPYELLKIWRRYNGRVA